MALLDALDSNNQIHRFLGKNENGNVFYRHGNEVFTINGFGQTRWYCTWASWITLGYQMAGVPLKKEEK